jgi:hypothetical protein
MVQQNPATVTPDEGNYTIVFPQARVLTSDPRETGCQVLTALL